MTKRTLVATAAALFAAGTLATAAHAQTAKCGGEKSGGSRHESTLGHDGETPWKTQTAMCRCGSLSCMPIYGHPAGGDHPPGFTLW